MKTLVVLPVCGSCKGIPCKNVKEFNGKPLICYSIYAAHQITSDEDICITTDDDRIIKIVEDYGLTTPFKRPDYLATNSCGSNEVIQRAYSFYEKQGKVYDAILFLQPTSPFRKVEFLPEAVSLLDVYFRFYNNRRLHQILDYRTPDDVYYGPCQILEAA